MNTLLLKWLQETLNRFFRKQPQYFKYWTWLSSSALIISGIPYFLVQFNIVLPEPFATLSNKIVTIAATTMLFMSMLTVKSPVVGQTTEGSQVQVTDEKKLPFTAQDEKKMVDEAKPPLEVMPEVPETPPDETKP